MKRYLLILLLSLSILAQVRGNHPAVENITGGVELVQTKVPHVDLHLAYQLSVAVPQFRLHQYAPDSYSHSFPAFTPPSFIFNTVEATVANQFAKRYLTHIHPSHNFW